MTPYYPKPESNYSGVVNLKIQLFSLGNKVERLNFITLLINTIAKCLEIYFDDVIFYRMKGPNFLFFFLPHQAKTREKEAFLLQTLEVRFDPHQPICSIFKARKRNGRNLYPK